MGNKPAPARGKKVVQAKVEQAAKTGVLNLEAQQLRAVPDAVLAIDKLTVLDMTLNRLEELPPGLSSLQRLKTLHLARNVLRSTAPVASLQRLHTLTLSGNTRLEAVELPPSLTELTMESCELTDVPLAVVQLSSLRVLTLNDNALDAIPDMDQLVALVELYLDDCRLSELPLSISSCTRLKLVSLRRNRLGPRAVTRDDQSIPEGLFTATAVDRINLEGNPLSQAQASDMAGVEAFLSRRLRTKEKGMQGGAILDHSLFGLT